jgi:hypothetical protein
MAVALFLASLVALILSVGAGANPNKPYSIKVCGGGESASDCTSAHPGVIAPNGNLDKFHPASSVTVIFTNDNKLGSGIQLGSDNLNVPSTPQGFSVLSVSLPQGNAAGDCPLTFNNSAPPCFVFLSGGGVGFRNLNLAPGQSMAINMTAATPAAAACTTPTSCPWSDEAKQSNDFSGTGNDLNSDSNSSYDTLTGATASCGKNGCITTLDNGGTANSAQGSISTTVSTAKANTTVTQVEAIDFGMQLPTSPTGPCQGVVSNHMTFQSLSNGGSDRSQTITIQTTDFLGYQSEVCFATTVPFTALNLSTGQLQAANGPLQLPDGTQGGFEGVLPDCGNQANQVNCNKTPGVVAGSRNLPGSNPHTIAAQIPPGFDSWAGN